MKTVSWVRDVVSSFLDDKNLPTTVFICQTMNYPSNLSIPIHCQALPSIWIKLKQAMRLSKEIEVLNTNVLEKEGKIWEMLIKEVQL